MVFCCLNLETNAIICSFCNKKLEQYNPNPDRCLNTISISRTKYPLLNLYVYGFKRGLTIFKRIINSENQKEKELLLYAIASSDITLAKELQAFLIEYNHSASVGGLHDDKQSEIIEPQKYLRTA